MFVIKQFIFFFYFVCMYVCICFDTLHKLQCIYNLMSLIYLLPFVVCINFFILTPTEKIKLVSMHFGNNNKKIHSLKLQSFSQFWYFIALFRTEQWMGYRGKMSVNDCSKVYLSLLSQFSVFLGIIFFLELTAGVLAFVFKDWIKDQLNFFINNNIRAYRDDIDLQNLIDFTQEYVRLQPREQSELMSPTYRRRKYTRKWTWGKV